MKWSDPARADLYRLYDFLLQRAAFVEDLDLAERALGAIDAEIEKLRSNPGGGRPLPGSARGLRELVIPFGGSGYLAAFTVDRDEGLITIAAVRHQRELGYPDVNG